MIRKQTKGQSVSETQIVYYTRSDLNVVVMVQKYKKISGFQTSS